MLVMLEVSEPRVTISSASFTYTYALPQANLVSAIKFNIHKEICMT